MIALNLSRPITDRSMITRHDGDPQDGPAKNEKQLVSIVKIEQQIKECQDAIDDMNAAIADAKKHKIREIPIHGIFKLSRANVMTISFASSVEKGVKEQKRLKNSLQ